MPPRPPIDFDAVRIATPCSASWDAMTDDARQRFCGQCRLHVYDVSALTRREAEMLLSRGEGQVCLRLHRRADGRIITKDCGRVRAAIERRIRWVRAAAASVLALVGFAGCSRDEPAPKSPTGGVVPPPSRPLMGDVCAPADPSTMGRPTTGNVSPPPLPPAMGEAEAPPPPHDESAELGDVTPRRVDTPLGGK